MAKKAKAAVETPARSPEEIYATHYEGIIEAKIALEKKEEEARSLRGIYRSLLKAYTKAGGDAEAFAECLALRKLDHQVVERKWRNINKHAQMMKLPIGTQLGLFDAESIATKIENEQLGDATTIDRAYFEGREASDAGKNRDTCPYKAKRLRDQWEKGWDDSQHERAMGMGPKEPEPVEEPVHA
jgi:ribosome modulation factor